MLFGAANLHKDAHLKNPNFLKGEAQHPPSQNVPRAKMSDGFSPSPSA